MGAAAPTFETGSTVTPNQNFGKINARQFPRAVRRRRAPGW